MKLAILRKSLFTSLCLLPMYVFGVTINVETEGTLEQVIEDSDELSFKELKITGRLNAVDIKFLRSNSGRMATIETLDLSEATIVSGGGSYASVSYNLTDNTMDNYKITFYPSEENRKDTTITSNMMGGNVFTIDVYSNNLAGAFAGINFKKVLMPQNVQEIGVMTFFECPNLTTVETTQPLKVIGDMAFQGCASLQDLDLSHVKELGEKAFFNCKAFRASEEGTLDLSNLSSIPAFAFSSDVNHVNAIKHVNFSPKLKSIGTSAFKYCEQLEEVQLPEGLQKIGYHAFYGCSSLATVTLPSTVEMINYDMFGGTPWVESLTPDNGVLYINNVAVSYTGGGIRDLVFKEGTTAIGDGFSGYAGRSSISSISLPSTLKKIGAQAFAGCTKLTSFVLPEGLISLGTEAFSGCGITALSLPASLTELGEKAFADCRGLNTLELPATLKKISDEAFSGCSGLTELNLPSSLEVIGGGAFSGCSSLSTLVIPESVKEIGYSAFYGCTSLSGEVIIPEGVERLGSSIFENANVFRIKYLATDAINKAMYYDTKNEYWYIPEIFSAEQVVIGANVRSLPSGFFMDCKQLKKVTFEERSADAELVMGNSCFSSCVNLATIVLPKTTKIGASCFSGTSLTSIVFPDGLTYVGDGALAIGNLKTADLGKSVTHIGNDAFFLCQELESVSMGDKVEFIGDNAFEKCKKLETVELPEGLTYLGERVFQESGITHLSIPGSVKQIKRYSFSECENLTSIELGEGIESIGERAFAFCSSLKEVVLPEGFKVFESDRTYGGYTFRNCSSLKRISLPSTLQELGTSTFSSVPLETITCYLREPIAIGNYVFAEQVYWNARLIVPAGTKTTYQADSYWGSFENIEEMASSSDLISISDFAITAGHKETINVYLKNEASDYTAYQFDLVLPEGIDIAKNISGKWEVMKGDRYEDNSHSLSIENVDYRTYRFICVSTKNALITGKDGAILSMALHANASLEEDEYIARIKNIVITRSNEKKEILQSNDIKIAVSAIDYIPGDANKDETVDVADAVAVVNYVINKPGDNFSIEAADINSDGEVDVFDVTKIIAVILSRNNSRAVTRAMNEVALEDINLYVNNNHVELGINGVERFSAFQLDVEVPEGTEMTDVALTANNTSHNLQFAKVKDGLYRVIGVSMNNATLTSFSDKLMELQFSGSANGDLHVGNVVFVSSDGEKTFFKSRSIDMMDIETGETIDDVYDLQGRRIDADRTHIKRGIYIIKGKKVVK